VERRSINQEYVATRLKLKAIYISVMGTIRCQIKSYCRYGIALLKLNTSAKTEKKVTSSWFFIPQLEKQKVYVCNFEIMQ
jgi:hypothetical protein